MFRNKRPPPLRIKSFDELDPNFRPRWVKARTWGLVLAIPAIVVLPVVLNTNGLLIALVLLQPVAAFIVFPRGFSAFCGIFVRHYPALANQHQRFEEWMQYDLDYDEQKR